MYKIISLTLEYFSLSFGSFLIVCDRYAKYFLFFFFLEERLLCPVKLFWEATLE